MFLRNVGSLSPRCTASYPRRQNSSYFVGYLSGGMKLQLGSFSGKVCWIKLAVIGDGNWLLRTRPLVATNDPEVLADVKPSSSRYTVLYAVV
jgi:hypothetical protein